MNPTTQPSPKHAPQPFKKVTKSNLFNKGLVVFAIVIIIIGIATFTSYVLFTNKYVTTNDAQVDQYIIPVASRISGYIKEVKFNENQYVHKGDTLVIIDDQELVNKYEMAAASLEAATTNVGSNAKPAVVQEKEAALKNASLFLSYTVITAPYDGWIGRQTIQAGQLVKEGQVLVHVVSDEKWITANFRETQIGELEVGNTVKIKVDAFPDQEFYGVIQSFSPASGAKFSILPPDNSTGNFVKVEQRIPIRIEFKPQQDLSKLRAGMNVVVNSER